MWHPEQEPTYVGARKSKDLTVCTWQTFIGRVETMEWGKSTYTVLPIPKKIAESLTSNGARRVEIELNDHPFNMALTKSPAFSGTFVYTGKTILLAAAISPGEEIEVRLRTADPDLVEVPDDVMLAIRAATASDAWSALTPGKQRSLLHTVNTARRSETRDKRIEQLILSLRS